MWKNFSSTPRVAEKTGRMQQVFCYTPSVGRKRMKSMAEMLKTGRTEIKIFYTPRGEIQIAARRK
ncbi:MAG: hypothetical protein J6K37_06780 [Lachnospiraceae bacterium]|nr:hypothetical protein [Lachnospiraceae bacterium]